MGQFRLLVYSDEIRFHVVCQARTLPLAIMEQPPLLDDSFKSITKNLSMTVASRSSHHSAVNTSRVSAR